MLQTLKLGLFIVFAVTLFPATVVYADDHDTQKAVLVTGASSGIGLKITEKLAGNGFYVYATARKDADLERLDAMDNVSSVQLDVTMQEQIDAALVFIKDQGRGLFGVVNNAGVGAISAVGARSLKTATLTPFRNLKAPLVTTVSPGSNPEVTDTKSPRRSPNLTNCWLAIEVVSPLSESFISLITNTEFP